MYRRNDEMLKMGLENKLIYAVATNDLETVEKRLIGISSRQLNMKYASYDNPLLLAVNDNNQIATVLLIKAGANIETKDSAGCTPLAIALKQGYEDLAHLLINQGANVCHESSRKISTLHYAAASCGRKTIEYLLDKDLDINYLSSDNLSALDFTTNVYSNGNLEAVKTLVDNGIESTIITKAFRRACWMGNDKIAKILLERGADVNIVMGQNGKYPETLFWLCRLPNKLQRTRYLKIIRLLLAHNINFENSHKFIGSILECIGSPLEKAKDEKFYDAVNLIQYGKW